MAAVAQTLTLTGRADINGTSNTLANVINGNSGANSLYGGDGNDTLDGGIGDDSLVGGAGDDTYVVDSASDVVVENSAEGADLVQSSVSFTIAENVENLTLTGYSRLNGTGNTLANVITGNSGANNLSGLEGNDTLDGGTGDDTFAVGSGTDTIMGLSGGDILTIAGGATANATVTAAWTGTSGTTNSGTATLTTAGFGVDLSAVTGGTAGFCVSNTGCCYDADGVGLGGYAGRRFGCGHASGRRWCGQPH